MPIPYSLLFNYLVRQGGPFSLMRKHSYPFIRSHRSRSGPHPPSEEFTHMPSPQHSASPFSRRSFFRLAAGASALATVPIVSESHLAMAAQIHFSDPNKGVHIDANENPMGPS